MQIANMRKATPTLSVCLLCCNQGRFVAEAIESVLAQTCTPLEIVISDDASADDGPAIIRRYAARHVELIRPRFQSSRLGFAESSNRAMAECRGSLIAFLAADDLMLAGKLTHQVAQFAADPGMVLSYHGVEVFDDATGHALGLMDTSAASRMQSAEDILRNGGIRNGCSVVVRRSAVHQPFHPKLNGLADLLFQVEVAISGRVGWLPQVLGRYRRHATNMTNRHAEFAAESVALLEILRTRYAGHAGLAQAAHCATPGFVRRTEHAF